ncbi:MAG: hypothetical protein ACQERN_04790 [Thermodesulfobacteriota bacterium]
MNQMTVFVIRALVAGFFAFVLTRVFRPEANLLFVALLAVFLVGTAYGLDYLRKNKQE